mgnify:CR=1 FL=1
MRGRVQAAVVAIVGSWFPLISPAAVALVSLRRGPTDGLQVLMWALLPALVALFTSQMGPLMGMATVAGLVAVFMASLLLRSSVSWAYAMFGLVGLSTLATLLLAMLVPDPVQGLTAALGGVLEQLKTPEGKSVMAAPSETFILGLIAYAIALNGLLSLLLARWWQAALYNPDGFQAEFHQLRLTAPMALVCMAATLYCMAQSGEYQTWGSLFALPLLIVGIAIVHRTVKALNMGAHWLVLFYLAMLLFSPVMLGLSTLAFIDTWVNFRGRLKPKS